MAPRADHPPHINPEQALRLFRIPATATLRELNASYRRVVSRYHPDHNPTRREWAHEAMIKINAAYDAALEYLAALRYEEIEARLDAQIKAHDRFTELFAAVANSVLEGVYIYYQYGLENVFIRMQGVPRFRYRLALRKVAAGISQLERLQSPNSVDAETLEIFTSFAVAFLQCMRMKRSHDPSTGQSETAAHRHYDAGSTYLDQSIKTLLFRNEFSSGRRMAAPHSLAVSHAEFMKVLTEHSESSWVTEAAIKVYLLDVVEKLEEVGRRVPSLGIGQ
jgi:hypothetical protein